MLCCPTITTGFYPPWTMMDAEGLPLIPWPPYCPASYIECYGDGNGAWVQGDLPELEAPGSGILVPSVFNWITGGWFQGL